MISTYLWFLSILVYQYLYGFNSYLIICREYSSSSLFKISAVVEFITIIFYKSIKGFIFYNYFYLITLVIIIASIFFYFYEGDLLILHEREVSNE